MLSTGVLREVGWHPEVLATRVLAEVLINFSLLRTYDARVAKRHINTANVEYN